MKLVRLVMLAAIGCAIAMLGACASNAPITAAQLQDALHNVALVTQAGCTVVQPTLAAGATATANPVAATAAGVNGIFCAAQAPLVAATAAPTSAPVTASAPVPASTPLSAAPIK